MTEFGSMDRRELIRGAILLVGGTLAAGSPAAGLAQTKRRKPARFFTPAEFKLLSDYADTMIPRTDSPGAKDAGVPESMDALMVNWASDERQAQFRALVRSFGTAGLASTPASKRLELVRSIDAQKRGAGDPVYMKFRELVLTLYYLSEAGATKELRYELIPGKWDPATVIGTDTRAWAV